jgi:hypothetical protein
MADVSSGESYVGRVDDVVEHVAKQRGDLGVSASDRQQSYRMTARRKFTKWSQQCQN